MEAREERERMVERDIERRGIDDDAVLEAMRTVPREAFVPEDSRGQAYDDSPLPIGHGQTISQPYIVALMASELELDASSKVLEVGTGSGYAAAVLGRLAGKVYGVERVGALAERAAVVLEKIGAQNVQVKHDDGTLGWAEHAPFDAIMVSAGGAEIPDALVEQLAPGGRLVMPIGTNVGQELVRVEKGMDGSLTSSSLGGVRFVPLVSD